MRMRAVLLSVLLISLSACGGSPLYSALDEQQANEIEAALLRAGIDAEKQPSPKGETWAVRVPHGDVPLAMQVLAGLGLPRAVQSSLGEVFEKKGFVSSPLEERARYLYALSQELAATLMQLDGVVSARVHVALPQRDVLGETAESASASVVIIHDENVPLAERETDIKAIVTDGIEGLDDVNRVTVKFFPRSSSARMPVAAATHAAMRPAQRWQESGAAALLGIGGAGGWLWWNRRQRRNATSPRPAQEPSA